MMRMTETVKQLLIINIIFFIGSQFVGMAYPMFSMYYPGSNNFRIWQPLTHMFMHAPMPNLMHIVFNMFALVSFGSALEQFWGAKKFLFFYISCGLGAVLVHTGVTYYQIHSLLDEVSNLNLSNSQIHILLNADYKSLFDGNNHMIVSNVKSILDQAQCSQSQFDKIHQAAMTTQFSTVVGASGAIYGLLIAFTFMFPNAELAMMFIPIPVKAKYFVPIYMLLYDGFFGIFGNTFFRMSDDVAHFAHIGGAITGFLMMWYWKHNQFNKNRWN